MLDQTCTDHECIIVDDASNDDTTEVINSFDDDRLIFLRHEENRGASAARNTGITHSGGRFIAFLDDDDEWLPNKLEKQVVLLSGTEEKIGMVYCWMDYYDEKQNLVYKHHPTLKGYVFPQVLDDQRLGGCPTLLVKRQVFDKIGSFDESLPRGNDGDFIRRACRRYEVDLVPEVLVKVHVDHGKDRISDQNIEGIQNHINSIIIKLNKFQYELDKLPEQRSNILFDLAHSYAKFGKYSEALYYFMKALKSKQFSKEYFKIFLSNIKSIIILSLKHFVLLYD